MLLVASGMWYIQTKAKVYMMKKQKQLMSKQCFMNQFNYHHELAFGDGSAAHGLHNDGGLPEEANGGWYSNGKLSYREWYGMSTARMAYNELVEKNPKQVFNLLVSSLNFPWLAIGSGILYCISAVRRVKALYKPNGI